MKTIIACALVALASQAHAGSTMNVEEDSSNVVRSIVLRVDRSNLDSGAVKAAIHRVCARNSQRMQLNNAAYRACASEAESRIRAQMKGGSPESRAR